MSSITPQTYTSRRGFDDGAFTSATDGFSIGKVAEATGLSLATLRAWEARHGFPSPPRSDGTHRRYSADEVDAIKRVMAARSTGLSLAAAIELERQQHRPRSIYASVRERWPHLAGRRLGRPTMLAISRAIEDECCARAATPFLLAAFQTPDAYRPARARWADLSHTAAHAIVLAAFPGSQRRRDAPTEIAVAADDPIAREWAVICDAPGASTCLVGWETHDRDSSGRRFEAIWSVDPLVVRHAALAGLSIAGDHAADSVHLPTVSSLGPLPSRSIDTARLVALTERIVVDVDTALGSR